MTSHSEPQIDGRSVRSRRQQVVQDVERWLRRQLRLRGETLHSILSWIAIPAAFAYGAASVLRETRQPDAAFWTIGPGAQQGLLLAVLGVVSVAYVAFGSVVNSRVAAGRERQLNLEELTQSLLVNFYEACENEIPITNLVAHVMRLKRGVTGSWFERAAVVKLDSRIQSTNVVWKQRKGAVGAAWDERRPYTKDLTPLHDLYQLGPEKFDEAPAATRLGLSAAEFKASIAFWCVYVAPLVHPATGKLVGVATVSCTEPSQYERIRQAAKAPGVDEPVTFIELLVANA